MKEIIIIGAGGHALILIDIIERTKSFRIAGIIGSDKESAKNIMGYSVYPGDKYLDFFYNQGIRHIGIGVGGYSDNLGRKRVYQKVKALGYNVPNLIDPSAVVSKTVVMGDAVVVFAGVVINTGVSIGNNVIIATSSSIDHETSIEDHVLISAGVTVGAGDRIGEASLIALGSKIISRVNICPETLVGAGAVVTKNITEPGTYLGIPARKVSP